ncbi:hypothetical protein INR49_020796, partial [Caranx melampygus]
MIQILKHFGWTWVGLLVSDDDYGLHVAQSLQSDLAQSDGGCLAYLEVLPWDSEPSEIYRIVHLMKTSTARVVMVFAHDMHLIPLMEEVVRQNVTGLQWIASEAWTAAAVLQTPRLMPYLGGTLGIAILCSESCPPGTRMARKKGQPECCFDCIPCSEGKISNKTDSTECTSCPQDFWSSPQRDHCVPKKTEFLSYHEPLGICLTTTSLLGTLICAVVLGIFIYHRSTPIVRANNSELSFLLLVSLKLCFLCSLLFIGRPRLPEYNIYKAVYSLAYALDNMLQCEPGRGPFRGNSCATLETLEPWQLVHYLQNVNFTTSFGDEVSFDENGDVLPIYDITNWQWLPDGRINIQNVGEVKKSAFKGEELTLHEDKIFWNFESKQPPRSVCSESCPPGTRMARKKGEPECCFDCIPCSEERSAMRLTPWSAPVV